ncbi:MAG: hypothetical protein AB7F19_07820 [Candidatus Babeliales bacterium]
MKPVLSRAVYDALEVVKAFAANDKVLIFTGDLKKFPANERVKKITVLNDNEFSVEF